MNFAAVLFVLSHLLLILGASMLVPLAVALVQGGFSAESLSFVYAIVLSVVLGLAGRFTLARHDVTVRLREGFAIVTFSWLSAVGLGMLPFKLSGLCDTWVDAWFETMSGFTTTGASIFPVIEIIPPGLQLWRCMIQWLGGMGIIVLGVALLPRLGVGGFRLFKAEAPGGAVFEREQPRIADTAKDLWKLYLGMTIVAALVFWALGMTVLEAVCHAFTTLSTGGFSTSTDSLGHFSPALQWAVTVFMFLAGINFSIYGHAVRSRFRSVLGNSELRFYLLSAMVLIMAGLFAFFFADAKQASVRDIIFQVVSVMTSTGFASADFDQWPHGIRTFLFFGMIVGGCMGSTAGGLKMGRVLVFGKLILRQAHAMIYPHAINPVRVNGKAVDKELVGTILAFTGAFFVTIGAGTLVMAWSGYDLTTSMSASIASVSNFGPGLGDVGPTRNWAHLPDQTKWIMSILMMVGRLEIFSVFVLLTPWAWTR